MEKNNDFVIKYGVLKEYRGFGGDVVVPRGVKCIGHQAFKGCKKLTGITMPEELTMISYQAFFGCTRLTSITLPDGMTSIDAGAFQKNPYLHSVANSWYNRAS